MPCQRTPAHLLLERGTSFLLQIVSTMCQVPSSSANFLQPLPYNLVPTNITSLGCRFVFFLFDHLISIFAIYLAAAAVLLKQIRRSLTTGEESNAIVANFRFRMIEEGVFRKSSERALVRVKSKNGSKF